MNIAAQRYEIERTRIGYNHALMSFPIYIKAGRKRVNVAKEVATVNKLRLSMERSLTSRMISLFKSVGNDAAREYRAGGVINGSIANMKPKLNNIFRTHYTSVIETFAGFANQDRKADSPFQRLIEKYHTTYTAQKVTGISETTRVMMQSVILSADEEGLGVAGTAKLLREFGDGNISRARAATIARTETHGAASWAQHEQHKENDFPMIKRWVSVSDARTRNHHVAMNGTEVKMDDDFEVVYRGTVYSMAYTHDPRGGAANNINCRCVTLYFADEDIVFEDERAEVGPVEETVEQVPDGPFVQMQVGGDFRSPNLTRYTNATFPMISRKDAENRLKNVVEQSAIDERYNRVGRFTKWKAGEEKGTIKGFKGLSDDSVSMVALITDELNYLADYFKIPRLRGYRTIARGRAVASQGDGIMNLNTVYFNEYAKDMRENIDPITAQKGYDAAKKDFERVSEEYRKIVDDRAILGRQADRGEITDSEYSRRLSELEPRYLELRRTHAQLRGTLNNLRRKIRSEWKPGEGSKPWTAESYHTSGIDHMRATMYHEFGHHVHQYHKMRMSERGGVIAVPLENRLKEFWKSNFRLKRRRVEILTTEYAESNEKEFFAEQFSLWAMGKRDKVTDQFNQLIQEVIDDRGV